MTPVRVYSRLLDPTEHPDFTRRAVRPPTWATFDHRTQFTCLRTFELKDGRILAIREELERHTRTFGLGRVVWPSYPVLFASNLGELADEIRRRELFLFDIWGYVPGSGDGGYWRQFTVAPETLALLASRLGDRWLGTDIGEQDGRYLSGYAAQMTPASVSREEQYLNFQRHFERMGDDLGHRHATLVSLNFGHYFLKEGTYTLIGAETAQALPNNQVYYAFIRGAGKQYGVPWFGNASVFNRWGYKSYLPPGVNDGYAFGPTKGTSLRLLKRLLYTHLLYNGMLAGFETGWIENGELTPIGKIQQAANRWVATHGQPGAMHTPVALLLDFHAGWSFPRHLYSERVYRVWGNLPYGPGDYLTDAILDLLYPGYQNSSYYHDESGFTAPTPFGDIADCLLSDAAGWLLERYPVIVVAGELAGGQEIRDKLQLYLERGGHLVMTSGNRAKLPGGLAANGRGRLTVFESEFGVTSRETGGALANEVDRPLAKPFVLEDPVRDGLTEIFRSQALFEVVGEGLSVVTCRKGPGEYTVGIANAQWGETPFRLTSRCGEIQSVQELVIDEAERAAEGCFPEGVDAARAGRNHPDRIAGGDVRIFAIKVAERAVEEIAHRVPPARPQGRWLTLRSSRGIKPEVLARPTFFEHYDGVVVDWQSLHERERSAVTADAGWIRRQGLRVAVDLSSGLNHYPTLRLVDNVAADYAASMAAIRDVLEKMTRLGATDLLLSLHRAPENNITADEVAAGFDRTLATLADEAAERGITLHLRQVREKATPSLADLAARLARLAKPNLKIAPALSLLLADGANPADFEPVLRGWVGLWLAASARRDIAGALYDAHAPLHFGSGAEQENVGRWLALAPQAPVVFDAIYADRDAEYRDARALARIEK